MNDRARKVTTSRPQKPIIPNWLIVVIILWVMAMWTGSIVYSISNPKWPIPASVHAAVPVVLTGVMGFLALKGRGNGRAE